MGQALASVRKAEDLASTETGEDFGVGERRDGPGVGERRIVDARGPIGSSGMMIRLRLAGRLDVLESFPFGRARRFFISSRKYGDNFYGTYQLVHDVD